MTGDESAFLRAIDAAPEDDAPRLAYADWLDENDQGERAEFIRLSIESVCWPPMDDPVLRRDDMKGLRAHYAGKWRRLDKLLAVERMRMAMWTSTDDPVKMALDPRHHPCPLVYRRGFVDSVLVTTAGFLAHAAALFAAHPVTSVRLTDATPECEEADPHWGVRVDHASTGCRLPGRLFDLLGPPQLGMRDTTSCRYYDTDALAHAALSAACVAYGRKLAGLPAISLPAPRP